MKWFRIYNADRTVRKVAGTESFNINELLENASTALGYKCTSLVLECDGTNINQDEYLKDAAALDVFIALQDNEEWHSPTFSSPSPLIPVNSKQFAIGNHGQPISSTITKIPCTETQVSSMIGKENYGVNNSIIDNHSNEIGSRYIPAVNNNDNDFAMSEDDFHEALASDIIIEDPSNDDVTMKSTSTTSTEEKRKIRQDFKSLEEIPIPWKKFRPDVRKAISAEKRLTNDQLLAVSREIVKNVCPPGQYIPESVFDKIAKNMARQKPHTFLETDNDGTIVHTGYSSFANTLKSRYYYCLRPHKIQTANQKLHRNVGSLRKNINLFAGNINNRPDRVNNDTYCLIREDITDGIMSVADILQKHPDLAKIVFLREHFKNLCEVNSGKMVQVLKEKSELILKLCHRPYAKKNKAKKACDDEAAISSEEEVDDEVVHDDESMLQDILEKICNYFGDDIDVIIHRSPHDNSNERIFIAMKEPPKYTLIVDGNDLLSTTLLSEAIEAYYICFYIFCALYPKKASRLLEFLQRFGLQQNPLRGSRSTATLNQGANRKVLTFIKKLNEAKQ
ncbi:hypothetical protein DMENIID0001_004280 [Sergentomyia squamirostris]